MYEIFISYRREDSADDTAWLYDRLERDFGPGTVFMDVDDIPYGVDFREHIRSVLAGCKVLLAIIGHRWIDAVDSSGRRRLDDPEDFVRVEIELAFQRNTPVVPVLVQKARMPTAAELPAELSKLAYQNAAQLRSGPDFRHQLDRLVRTLAEQYGIAPAKQPRSDASSESRQARADDHAASAAARCPICGRENLLGRIHCTGCGAALREPCLACGEPVENGEAFCGACGTDVAAVLHEKVEKLESAVREIDALRRAHRYDEAIARAEPLTRIDHPRLKPYADRAAELLAEIRRERAHAEEEREQLLSQAEERCAAFDYHAAVQLLERIAQPLRDERVVRLLSQARACEHEIAGLREQIRADAASGNHGGLLAKAARFLKLKPADPEVEYLQEESRRSLETATLRAEIRAAEASGRYEGLQAKVERLLELEPDDAEAGRLLSELPELTEIERLRAEIRAAEAAADYAGLRAKLERLLELRPGDAEAEKLRAELPRLLEAKELMQELRGMGTGPRHAALFTKAERLLELRPGDAQCRTLIASLYARKQWLAHRFDGHKDEVIALAFSSGGRSILSFGDQRTAHLWNVETGREIRCFDRGKHSVVSVSFSGDGRQVLSAGTDKTLRLWDATTGEEVRRFTGCAELAWVARHAPDGRCVFCLASDKTIHVWNTETGERLLRLGGRPSGVMTAWLSKDSRHVLLGRENGTVQLWDVEANEEIRRFGKHDHEVRCVAFSRDGRHVLSGSLDGTVRLWDAESGEETRRFEHPAIGVVSASFSRDGRFVLSRGHEKSAYLWDVETGTEIRRFESGLGVVGVSLSPDGRYLLSRNKDKTMQLWDTASGEPTRRLTGHQGAVRCTVFSRDARRVLSGSDDETIRIWDTATGQHVRCFAGHKKPAWKKLLGWHGYVNALSSSPNGRYAASGSYDGTVRLWYADPE